MVELLQIFLFVVALILANGLFAAAEIAVVSVRKSRIRTLVEEGSASARKVESLHKNVESFLATVQVGITLVGALAAAIGGNRAAGPLAKLLSETAGGVLAPIATELSIAIIVISYTFLSVVLGELVPKSLAMRHAEPVALRLSGMLLALRWLARPAVWSFTSAANLVLRPFKDRTTFAESRMTMQELRLLVEEAAEAGAIEEPRAEIIGRAVDFGELTAADVLVPRSRIVAVERSVSLEELRRVLLEEGHNRLPVIEGSLDAVVGYITVRDVLTMSLEPTLVNFEDAIRPAFFVPQTMRAVELLRALQRRHEHLAIVVDEYGGTAGICTTEDLVEEIVGEIFSEDTDEPPLIRYEADGRALLMGVLPVREFNREFEADLPDDIGFDTLGGFLTHLAGAIPSLGQRFEYAGFELTVAARNDRQVELVRVQKLPVAATEEGESEE